MLKFNLFLTHLFLLKVEELIKKYEKVEAELEAAKKEKEKAQKS